MCEHMFVVTGGPGSGKTSLIDSLTRRGFRSMPEAGRAIIQDQAQIGGTSLPWADRSMYAELMLGWELRSWHEAQAIDGPVLMDRGIADVVGYLTLCGLPVPAHIETAAKLYTYNRRVFPHSVLGGHLCAGRRAQTGSRGGPSDRQSHGGNLCSVQLSAHRNADDRGRGARRFGGGLSGRRLTALSRIRALYHRRNVAPAAHGGFGEAAPRRADCPSMGGAGRLRQVSGRCQSDFAKPAPRAEPPLK